MENTNQTMAKTGDENPVNRTSTKLIDRIVKVGANPEYAAKLVKKQYDYIERTYSDSTIAQKADVMMSIVLN